MEQTDLGVQKLFRMSDQQWLSDLSDQNGEQQVTRDNKIVASGWAGAAIPHSHPTPHLTPFPTQTHTQKASKTLAFPPFDSATKK